MPSEQPEHDRRLRARGAPHGEPPREQIVPRVLAAFRELPGLSLHLHQAVRLFNLTPRTCQVILDDLVDQGRLRRQRDGQYALR